MEDFASDGYSYIHAERVWKQAIIDLEEVMAWLKYKDIRSVLGWCKKHQVFVLNQGNTQVVNRIEFMLAFHKPFMEHLKRTKENWKELFLDYVCGNMNSLIREGSEDTPEKTKDNYVQRSGIESSFLKKMEDI